MKGIQGSVAGALFDVNSTSNHVQIYFSNPNGPVGNISSNGTATAYNTTSDRRVKEDITDTREGLQKLMRLPVRDFAFKADPSHTIVTGFIAQEMEKVFPEAVTTNGDSGDTKLTSGMAPWSVDYGRVTPLIVKAVQDLKHLFDADHDEMTALKADNDNLRITVETQKKRIDALITTNGNILRRVERLESRH